MKKAWIENSIIRDIAHSEPSEIYHTDIAVHYTAEVPDDAENGDTFANGVLTKPVIPEPTPIEIETIEQQKQRATIVSIEADFQAFLDLKNIDSIGEASALLNSTNLTWQEEAKRAVELWDLTWQAFYNNTPLPELSWL